MNRQWSTSGLGRLVVAVCLAAGIGLSATPLAAGAEFELEDYAGKVVVVDFWASWCVPCRRSFPWLNEMQAKYADDGLVVIGVNVDTDAEASRAFLEEFPVEFRIVEDPDGELATAYDVIAMPSSFIIGRQGEIAATHLGFKVKKTDEYEAAIREALAAGAEI